jgi:hypothetical protein
MSDNNHTPLGDKDTRLQRKKYRDSNEFIDCDEILDRLKRIGTLWKIDETDLKAGSIRPIARRLRDSRPSTDTIEVKKEKWTIDTLIAEMYSQLDDIWLRDAKDGNMKRKYRRRARLYEPEQSEDGLEPFTIDVADLTARVKEEFFSLGDGAQDYVVKEVLSKIFDSVGKPYLRLRVRDFTAWDLNES